MVSQVNPVVWGSDQHYPQDQDTQIHHGITTNHWVSSELRECCSNGPCKTKFTLFQRTHHCRRCGEVFCSACLKFQRRLNLLAHPDPGGKLYKVCKVCYDQGPQTIGQARNLLTIYKFYRRPGCHGENGILATKNGTNITNFRDQLDIDAECARLKSGFEKTSGTSSFRGTIQGLLHAVRTPDWQKSPFAVYGKMSKSCYVCDRAFSLMVSRHLCVVCGVAVCTGSNPACSNTDLLLYIPDGCSDNPPLQAEVAVVKIVGCPPEEPKRSTYLLSCRLCRQVLEDRQVARYHQERAALEVSVSVEEESVCDKLLKLDQDLKELQNKVDQQLSKYQELVESLELSGQPAGGVTPQPAGGVTPQPGGGVARPRSHHRSNMQVLAKAQCDLGDLLTSVSMKAQSLRSLKPQSQTEATLLKNYDKAWCEYYQENMYHYRQLKVKLEAITPLEVLISIQAIVDKNAINSCYLVVRQLALEALHLSSKHKLTADPLTHLVPVEEVTQKELQQTLAAVGETWEDHEPCVNRLVQQQLKDHRLIRPSRRQTQARGTQHVTDILHKRTLYVLQQAYLQLTTKCAEKSFSKTKAVLKRTAEGMGAEADWIVV